MAFDPDVGAVNYPAQHTWLFVEDELRADHLGRFEALGRVVEHLEAIVGSPLDLPHVHRTVRPVTVDAYDPGTASMVGEIFRRDVELGGNEQPVVAGPSST